MMVSRLPQSVSHRRIARGPLRLLQEGARSGVVNILLVDLLCCVVACGGSPAQPTGVCRRYASAYAANGTAYRCAFAPGNALLSCRSGPSLSDDWQYASAADFVDEARVPNRLRVRARRFEALGMVGTSRTLLTEYRYDDAGRLISRRRTNDYTIGSFELDRVEFGSWDSLGRPVSGTMHVGDRSGLFTLAYNDAAREVEASNGESVTLDANGNVVRETLASGFGESGRTAVEYVVQGTAEFCR
jgi:hypothetical protein